MYESTGEEHVFAESSAPLEEQFEQIPRDDSNNCSARRPNRDCSERDFSLMPQIDNISDSIKYSDSSAGSSVVNKKGRIQRLESAVITRVSMSSRHHRLIKAAKLLFTIGVSTAVFIVLIQSFNTEIADANSIYVPGAGFSGFWFSLGRLSTISDASSKNYYCFSAGCLAAVSTLSNLTVNEVSKMALDAQRQYQSGEITRYEVVSKFVDDLLYSQKSLQRQEIWNGTTGSSSTVFKALLDDQFLLSRLKLITTKNNGVPSTSVRTPKSIQDLREILLQTTWIPYATGNGVWNNNHNDGGFSIFSHPRCAYSVNLPLRLDLFLNFLNVNLNTRQLESFWNAGKRFGLQ